MLNVMYMLTPHSRDDLTVCEVIVFIIAVTGNER